MADELTPKKVAHEFDFIGLLRQPYRSKAVANGARGRVFEERLGNRNSVGIITSIANSFPAGGTAGETYYDIRIDGTQLFDQNVTRQIAPLTAPRTFDRPEWSLFPLIKERVTVDYTNATGGDVTAEFLLEVAVYEAPDGVLIG